MALDSLNHLFRTLECQPRWQGHRQFRQVLDRWGPAVGTGVARQTVPIKIDRQVLYVAVSSPTWAQTLSFERLRILAKLNDGLEPPLQDIRFSTGDWYRRPKPSSAPLPPDQAALQAHPSYLPPGDRLPALPPSATATAAFQQWAERLQIITCQQPLCPRCQCPCPPGELQRWRICSLCLGQSAGRGADG